MYLKNLFLEVFNLILKLKKLSYTNAGVTNYILSCSPTCDTSSASTTCCQTNNCNRISPTLPTKTVSSCYYGTQTIGIRRSCESPDNGYCQVNFSMRDFGN